MSCTDTYAPISPRGSYPTYISIHGYLWGQCMLVGVENGAAMVGTMSGRKTLKWTEHWKQSIIIILLLCIISTDGILNMCIDLNLQLTVRSFSYIFGRLNKVLYNILVEPSI
jgi:hypothetical protein